VNIATSGATFSSLAQKTAAAKYIEFQASTRWVRHLKSLHDTRMLSVRGESGQKVDEELVGKRLTGLQADLTGFNPSMI
jgi:hypothetical protein